MEFRYERYQALDRVAWINYQAKGIQATKMIRGFLSLLLIRERRRWRSRRKTRLQPKRPDRHRQPPRRHR